VRHLQAIEGNPMTVHFGSCLCGTVRFKYKGTSTAFACVIVSIAKKIRGLLMRQIYSRTQLSWLGWRVQMLWIPLRSQALTTAKAFVSCVVQRCQALRLQVCSSFRQVVWTLKSLCCQLRTSLHPAKLLGIES